MRICNNFRDLGGYKTKFQTRVKKGFFFRSKKLNDFTQEELNGLQANNVKKVFDFRSLHEVERDPDPMLFGVDYVHYPSIVYPDGSQIDFSPKGLEEHHAFYDKAHNRTFTEKVYGNLPFSPAYKEMIDCIQMGQTPILFHCTAGKDRTGIAAMIILMILGVDIETIVDDYMLSNTFLQEEIQSFMQRRLPQEYDEELYQMLLAYPGVSEANIRYSISKIMEKYASVEAYIEDVFGIDEQTRQKWIDLYTEPYL